MRQANTVVLFGIGVDRQLEIEIRSYCGKWRGENESLLTYIYILVRHTVSRNPYGLGATYTFKQSMLSTEIDCQKCLIQCGIEEFKMVLENNFKNIEWNWA